MKQLDASRSNALRLIRTESSHIHNTAELDAYKECGFEEYEFMASLGERTCEVCGGMDGKRIKLSDKQFGVNFPPLHPNCRCTTIAFDPDDDLSDFKAGELEYEQWYAKYVEGRDQPKLESKGGTEIEVPEKPVSPAPAIAKTAEIDAEVLTTGVGSGIIISREQQFFSDLKAGKINVQLDAKNQEKHIISDKWKNNAKQQHLKIISGDTTTGNPKSCLFREMDPQTLISKYAGTGRLVFDDLHGIVNEFIEIGYLVGLTYERRLKKFIRSTTLQIKYTKAGVHIFPTKRWDRGD